MRRWASFAVQATFLRERIPHSLLGIQPAHASFGGGESGLNFDLVRNEAVVKYRFVEVQVDGGVREEGVVPISLSEQISSPGEERLFGEALILGNSPRPGFGRRLVRELAGRSFRERRLRQIRGR